MSLTLPIQRSRLHAMRSNSGDRGVMAPGRGNGTSSPLHPFVNPESTLASYIRRNGTSRAETGAQVVASSAERGGDTATGDLSNV
jgi:hypothetical protein